jgi:eukaryotic-like serine/threonine-protein kinase
MVLFSRWHRLLFAFSCLLLLVGSVSCANPLSTTPGSNAVISPTNSPASTLKTPTGTTSAAANPDCPASGQGRAANMPGITPGNQQEIVSYRNANGSTTLNEFDVQDKTSSTIVSMDGETIQSAQLSQDGQWVMIVAETNSAWALQLVRVDGQDLQTLYCSSTSQKLVAQWSPNQQQIIFSQISAHETQLFLFNSTSGTLQVEYTDAFGGDLEPVTWLDNSHVYVSNMVKGLLYEPPDLPSDLRLLDTSKGANQQLSDLTVVMDGDSPWSFDCSLDGKTAYVTFSQEPPRGYKLTSSIYVESALSGNFPDTPIFTSDTIYITAVRVINATTLMILAEDPNNPQSSTNGLYTIQTNGSGLKQLVSSTAPSIWAFNAFSQYTWSNFSRNGAYYVDGLSYGSFNGGPLTTYGSPLLDDALVGWTTK